MEHWFKVLRMCTQLRPRLRVKLTLSACLVSCIFAAGAGAGTGLGSRPRQGSLLVATGAAEFFSLSLAHTEISAEVAGFVAQVEVRQVFTNPFPEPIEAIYVFPLNQGAAVHGLNVTIGDRKIRGQLQVREGASELYEQAKAKGHTAVLLEQERPNIFTQSVANIQPGHEIEIKLSFDVPVRFAHDTYELSFPTVVGPRFIPGISDGKPATGGGRYPNTDAVPDASRITPPLLPSGVRSGQDLGIAVNIDGGAPISGLSSPSHLISVEREPGSQRVRVQMAKGDRIPNKDFVLRYRLAHMTPKVIVQRYASPTDQYFSLTIEPPLISSASDSVAKEVLFVVDASQTMAGKPLELAKQVVLRIVAGLNSGDTFNIIAFNRGTQRLAPHSVGRSPASLASARTFLGNLRSARGKSVGAALRAVAKARSGADAMVIFVSDGLIGNEDVIVREVMRLGELGIRTHSVGIGSSVNRYLLESMAASGGGVGTYIFPSEDPTRRIDAFYQSIRWPLVTGVNVDWGPLAKADKVPAVVADLFAGYPVRVFGRLSGVASLAGSVRVSGRIGGKPVMFDIPLGAATGNDAIERLWARSKIRQLELLRTVSDSQAVRTSIRQVGLRHALVTSQTSLVAVDNTAGLSADLARTIQIPVELPAGMSRRRVLDDGFGEEQPPPPPTTSKEESRERQPSRPATPTQPAPAGAAGADESQEDDGAADAPVEEAPDADSVQTVPLRQRQEVEVSRSVSIGASAGIGWGDVNNGALLRAGLHIDKRIASEISVAVEAVGLLSLSDPESPVFGLLLGAMRHELGAPWLGLGAALGPLLTTSGDVGLDVTGVLALSPSHFPVDLLIRYERLQVVDAGGSNVVSAAIRLSF